MCKFKLTNIWWIRNLIRKIAPNTIPIDFRLEDVIAEVTTNIDKPYKSTKYVKITSETTTAYKGTYENGATAEILKYRLGTEDALEVITVVKKGKPTINIACELSEDEFESRLNESKGRCKRFAENNPALVRFGILEDLVKEKKVIDADVE